MFIPSVQGAAASTDSVANSLTSSPSVENATAVDPTVAAPGSPPPSHPDSPESSNHETVRHMLFGPLSAVQYTIRLLHHRGYAEVNDWSRPISTGKPNEMMAILTKRVRL